MKGKSNPDNFAIQVRLGGSARIRDQYLGTRLVKWQTEKKEKNVRYEWKWKSGVSIIGGFTKGAMVSSKNAGDLEEIGCWIRDQRSWKIHSTHGFNPKVITANKLNEKIGEFQPSA